jgi:hypothetical protein
MKMNVDKISVTPIILAENKVPYVALTHNIQLPPPPLKSSVTT